ncbi:hypothetical protein SAMN05660662_3843 [Blastococcus aurantiacus]|uniref:Uncharacterized protein n=1 Tax=Blastococcus aurantiacus TaxID=1550231 RepID=A0A1G7Q0D5_9ACTN|nr:hypothetical protein [Blastococcus aurantiacus]SDF91931.1 hypothetical protein SAMN05660662_3843 [Blastococcus aurantiacus]
MGKHTAADDSTVHPLVAAALSRRAGAPAGAHGEHSGGSTGWPEPEPGGGGAVGWPDDTREGPDDVQPASSDEPVDSAVAPVVGTAPLASRRGWRRLFGASPAA